MRLCIMKKDCLAEMKANLDKIYPYYFSESTNEWMQNLLKENPFQKFGKEIPDFTLAPLDQGLAKSEIDLENCKILYTNLYFLSESQACDERLWAGLTNGVFYEYMRKRCDYDSKKPKEKEAQASEIRSRYFFKGGARSGFYRNYLAKCWWVGRALYCKNSKDHFWKLDIIGARDFSTKVSDIFYSYSFSSNSEILDGIVMFFEHMNNEGFVYDLKKHIRPSMQHLNSVGGAIILDCLTKDEIKEELVDNLDHILIGDDDEAYAEYLEGDEELETDEDDLTSLTGDTYEVSESDLTVKINDIVTIKNSVTEETKRILIKLQEGMALLTLPELLLDKKIGDIVEFNNERYEIIEIKSPRRK